MNQSNNTNRGLFLHSGNKRGYVKPGVQAIVIDNEISLILNSLPPEGPDESHLQMSKSEQTDIFRA
jgi:hypothetical protein